MIGPRRVTDSGCSSCGENNRVVEFKIGRGATENVVDGSGLLVRLCYDCRRSLERHLAEALKADDADLVARSKEVTPNLGHYQNGADSCACGELWPCALQQLGVPWPGLRATRCVTWSYPGRSSWDGKLLSLYGGQQCALPSGHLEAHRLASIDELIDASSIGEGLRNIRENGIDAELARLELARFETEPSFRIGFRNTRKAKTSTRKKKTSAKARKKR